jgi:hypothetical protein
MSNIELPEFTNNLGAGSARGGGVTVPLSHPRLAVFIDRDRRYLRLYPHAEAMNFFEQFRCSDGHILLSCFASDDGEWLLVRGPLKDGRAFKVREGKSQRPHITMPLKIDGSPIQLRDCEAKFSDKNDGWAFKIALGAKAN